MKQIFAIGKGQVEVEIPDNNVMDVLHANLPDIPLDEQNTIKNALENPIGSPRLSEIVKPGEKVVIVTSDISRPMPSYKVLPAVLEEIKSAGVPNEDVSIVLALGSHRGHTDEEKKSFAGKRSLIITGSLIPTVKWSISVTLPTVPRLMFINRSQKRIKWSVWGISNIITLPDTAAA